jgi:hypothetical protein
MWTDFRTGSRMVFKTDIAYIELAMKKSNKNKSTK